MDDISALLAVGSGPGALALVLGVLALVDSTSFGTLAIPVWLLLSPQRPRPSRVLVYLGAVAVAYLALGIALLLGADVVLQRFGDVIGSRPGLVVQLVVGVALFVVSFRFDSKRSARRRAELEAAGITPAPGRLVQWRAKALAASTVRPLLALAVGAVGIEAVSMVPYLAAIGILSSSGRPGALNVVYLAAYCVVMVLPALLLLAGRVGAARAVEPVLRRLDGWFARNAESLTGWAIGIAGFLVARHAGAALSALG